MKLSPELIKNLPPEQMELLVELGELAEKESQLNEVIEINRRRAEKVGLGRERQQVRSLTDDPELEHLLSIKAIREKEQIREKIRSLLRTLIDSGLGELDIIKRQAGNYGVELKKK